MDVCGLHWTWCSKAWSVCWLFLLQMQQRTKPRISGCVRLTLIVLREATVQVNEERTGLAFKPLALVEVDDDEHFHQNSAIFERCLELDDVDAIYTTCADVGLNHK